MSSNGLISLRSCHGPATTGQRLTAEIEACGLTLFAAIDHAAAAAQADLSLRPTKLFIFGSALSGTPLMNAGQTIGIDLPLKVLVWQDATGTTWISYNDPAWLCLRHQLPPKSAAAVARVAATLATIARKAAASP